MARPLILSAKEKSLDSVLEAVEEFARSRLSER